MCRKSSFRETEQSARVASEIDKEQKEHMEGGAAQALAKQKGGRTCGNPAHPFSMRSRNVGGPGTDRPGGQCQAGKR